MEKNKLAAVLFWFLFVLLISCLFFISKDNIKKNLTETKFFETILKENPVKQNEPEQVKNDKTQIKQQEKNDSAPILEKIAPPVKTPDVKKTDVITVVGAQEKTPAKIEQKTQQPPANTQKMQELTLYFVSIDSSGTVLKKAAKRTLPVSDSPLSDSIRSLLAGPQSAEITQGAISLIPSGTELIWARVQNGTAILNFNENFQFNNYGVQGSFAQLMQIVFTATSFSTVKNVQFLIEGQKKEYLSNEGVWIGTPLDRSNFN